MSEISGPGGVMPAVVRTRAVGLLAAGLAHDLNNMLGGILATAELLQARVSAGTGTGAGEEVRDISVIVDQAVKASGLVRQILAFSRQDMLAPEVADLGDLLDRMIPAVSALTGPRVELLVRRGAGTRVRLDQTALERVVVNLVLNARDAILESMGGQAGPAAFAGRIELSIGRISAGERPEAGRGFMPAVPYGVLSVSDDGPGVVPAHAARIFEPYFTTRPHGQGLGLASAYGLVKQSGGFLLLEPSARGARFTVYLPEEAGLDGHQARARAAAGRSLLLVEDELMLRMSVARGLERQGWRVRQAPDGEAALRRLEAERPAVMVSDIRMPGLDGIALTEAARRLWPGLPVLLTSGYADEAARAAVPRMGVGFLPKPYTVRTLNERLREMV